MNISYYFKNLEPTEAIKEYTEEKVQKIYGRLSHIEGIDVRFALERQNQIFEITVRGDAAVFHLKKESKDLYAAIDNAIDALGLKIEKHHNKFESRHGNSDEQYNMIPLSEAEETGEELMISIYDAPAKPMDDFEAVLQLRAQRFRFLMYHRMNEKKYSLVFSRPDGNFSVILPRKESGAYEEHIVKINKNELEPVSVMLYPMAIVSIGEALERMNENNLEYYAFVNEDTRRMNVLFHGRNGEIALKRPAV